MFSLSFRRWVQAAMVCLLAVVADINGHPRPGYETEEESPSTPFQPDSDGVAEQDDHHRYGDNAEDHGMGAEAFHRSAPPSMGVHKSGV